ncbi:MAG TPA: right-handed parallel beta-helix repeat-containing protein [Blastocatellia bacterium]|nr:right-handed parallel beta-helix repeat-containing protein [Blastocatellia bacterium]
MKRLFVHYALSRLSSFRNCAALALGVACCAFTMMTISNEARSKPRSASRVAMPPQRGGRVYYVASTGSDSNPGSESRPFRTIQKAADSVNPGDTVLVDDGVYTYSGPNDCYGKVVVCVSGGGAPDNWVVFRSRNKWAAKIDGENGKAGSGFVVRGGASYVRIQDFEMTGLANANGSAGGIDLFDGGSDFQVIGNHIHNIGRVCANTSNGQNGVFIEANNVLVEGNLIHDNGRLTPGQQGCQPSNDYWKNHDHGIYHDGGDHVTIRNNIIYNIKQGWAIQVWPKSRAHMNILNNTIAFGNQHDGKLGAIVMWAPSTGGMKVSDSNIANNIFYGVKTAAVWMGGGSGDGPMRFANVRISNNIISNGVLLFAEKNIDTSGLALANNLEKTDPKFADPAAFDFHLRPDSPAIDAGLTLSGVDNDYDGRLRPRGVGMDIGAYEHLDSSSRTARSRAKSKAKPSDSNKTVNQNRLKGASQ